MLACGSDVMVCPCSEGGCWHVVVMLCSEGCEHVVVMSGVFM